MASGVTIYCEGLSQDQDCPENYPTRMSRAEYARAEAREHGWTRRQGIDLGPICSRREYASHNGPRKARP